MVFRGHVQCQWRDNSNLTYVSSIYSGFSLVVQDIDRTLGLIIRIEICRLGALVPIINQTPRISRLYLRKNKINQSIKERNMEHSKRQISHRPPMSTLYMTCPETSAYTSFAPKYESKPTLVPSIRTYIQNQRVETMAFQTRYIRRNPWTVRSRSVKPIESV